jgi:hypothetical protein
LGAVGFMLPSAPVVAVCSAPMMPPELSEAWIADCASDSQLPDVLDAMLRLGIAVTPHPDFRLAPGVRNCRIPLNEN